MAVDELIARVANSIEIAFGLRIILEIEAPCAGVEFVLFDPKPLLQSDEEIAQRHVFASAASRVYVALMFEAAARYKNRKIAIGVRTAVSHTAAEEDHGVVED